MRIIDTYDKIMRFFPTGDFSMAVWRDYANAVSGELADKAGSDVGESEYHRMVLPVIQAALARRAAMERAHESFCASVGGLPAKMREKLGTVPDADIILYLGLCNGAGWATRLDGRAAVLLGIEKIVELDWCGLDTMRALIYHELGHVWHEAVGNLRPKTDTQSGRALGQLHREGIAMHCEQLLMDDDSYYHQDTDGWLAWCRENADRIRNEYLRRIAAEEGVQDFFGDWQSFEGRSDTGYFLGCAFVKFMLRKYSLVRIANQNVEEIRREFVCYAGGQA